MPDDLDAAKAEFNTALPDWWYVVEESEAEYSVTLGPHDDADETYTYRLARPASAADALRHAINREIARQWERGGDTQHFPPLIPGR